MDELIGTDVLYRRWAVPSAKAVFLLVHGLGAHSARWDFLASFLARNGYASYGIELKGFGRTPERPRGHVDSYRVWDQDILVLAETAARGTIVGLTRGAGRNHLVRAALEAMAYSTRDVLETMRKDSGLKIRELRIDGGAAANEFLCQFQADVLGIPVLRPKTIETTSLGAAYLAGLAAGFWKDTAEIGRFWTIDKEFVPVMAHRQAEALYGGWKAAVARVLN